MTIQKIRVINNSHGSQTIVDARCPHCKYMVGFVGTGQNDYDIVGQDVVRFRLGVRKGPRPDCQGQLLIQEIDNRLVTYPRIMIDFNNDSIPEPISQNFEEALLCEANECYIASAIMVRKTLEMICDDRGANGSNLVARIKALRNQVTLPDALFDAMDNLRLLGNDAAHLELKEFDEIGEDELEVAIELTKEILKAIYQLDSIVSKLKTLKKVVA